MHEHTKTVKIMLIARIFALVILSEMHVIELYTLKKWTPIDSDMSKKYILCNFIQITQSALVRWFIWLEVCK